MNRTISRFVALAPVLIFITCTSSDLPPEEGLRPELAGAERYTGSLADENGNLPELYLEYITTADDVSQRLAIYRNGLVVLTTGQFGRKTDKKIIFPPDAIGEYEEFFSTATLRRVPIQPLKGSPTTVRETIRIFDEDGNSEERTLDPSLVLTSELERQRLMLRDLVEIIYTDREVSSPFNDYVPRPGDTLIDGEMKRWTVLRFHESEETLEITDSREVMRMYINIDQIDEMFIGFDRSGDEE